MDDEIRINAVDERICPLEQDVMARDVSDVCARTCAGERGAEGGRGRGSRARAHSTGEREETISFRCMTC